MSYLKSKDGSIEASIKEMQKNLKDNAYQQMFKKELEKTGKGIGSMSDMEKKDFFNKLDKMYKGKDEDLDSKDEPSVKDVANQLKKAVKAHGQQAKDLEKAIKSEEDESLEEASLYAFKEYEPSQQYEAGRDMKNIEDAIKKAGGRIKSKEKPTRREPNLSFEIETGNPTAVKAAIKKTDPEFNVESFDIEKLKEDVNTLWSTAGDSMEEMKKNAKYMKAQDVAPDNDSDAESEKEKSGKTLIGSKKTKIVTEPKVDYQK